MTTYHDRQAEQFRKFMDWVKKEGGVEGPTQLNTLLQPHQRTRLDWLAANAFGSVLEVGCNFGFVLAWAVANLPAAGHVGLDISPMNVELARLLGPGIEFVEGNATDLPFNDNAFDTVMIPETLEHLDWPAGVHKAVDEAVRVASKRVLITIPDGREDTSDATNFKHLWLADKEHCQQLLSFLIDAAHLSAGSRCHQEGFVLFRVNLE